MVARLTWRVHARRVRELRRLSPLALRWDAEPAWEPWPVIGMRESVPHGRPPVTAAVSEQVSATAYPLT
jgi:hypothetical protein